MKPLNELITAYLKRWQDSPDIAGLNAAAATRVLHNSIKAGKRTPVPPCDRETAAQPPATTEPTAGGFWQAILRCFR